MKPKTITAKNKHKRHTRKTLNIDTDQWLIETTVSESEKERHDS